MPPSVSFFVLCTRTGGARKATRPIQPWRLQRAMLRNLTLHGHAVQLDTVAARGLKHSIFNHTCARCLRHDPVTTSKYRHFCLLCCCAASRYSAQATNATTKTPTVLLESTYGQGGLHDSLSPQTTPSASRPAATGVPSSWGALYLGKSFERFQDWVVFHGVDNQVSLQARFEGPPNDEEQLEEVPGELYAVSRSVHAHSKLNRGSLVSNQAVRGVHTSQGVVDSTRWAMQPYPLLRLQDLHQLRQEGLDPSAVCSSSRFEQAALMCTMRPG